MLRKIRTTLAKGNAVLLTVYALFVLFPHFASFSHSHPGGDKPHSHSFLSLQNETLKRQILTTFGDGTGLKTVSMPVATQEEVSTPLISIERGTKGLQPTQFWHTHFQEDPNLLALGLILGAGLFTFSRRLHPVLSKQILPELAALRPLARGPPALSLLH